MSISHRNKREFLDGSLILSSSLENDYKSFLCTNCAAFMTNDFLTKGFQVWSDLWYIIILSKVNIKFNIAAI